MLPGRRSDNGALYITTVAPTDPEPRTGGVCLSTTGQIHVNASAPQKFDQGKGFLNNGALAVDVAGTAIANYMQGLPVTATGALKCQLNQTPAASDPYVGGIRVGPTGGVYITDVPVPLTYGYSNGFSNGFDASPP